MEAVPRPLETPQVMSRSAAAVSGCKMRGECSGSAESSLAVFELVSQHKSSTFPNSARGCQKRQRTPFSLSSTISPYFSSKNISWHLHHVGCTVLLSLMSLFDRQAIPLEFLTQYSKQQDQEPKGEIQLTKALGVLKAFSFIVEGKGHGLDMHRLVQLVPRKWLATENTIDQFSEQALLIVLELYPFGIYENWTICNEYLPHVYAVLKRKVLRERLFFTMLAVSFSSLA